MPFSKGKHLRRRRPLLRSSPEKVEFATQQIPVPKYTQTWFPKIGLLWDCRKTDFINDSIFLDRGLGSHKYLEVVPNYDMNYTLFAGGNTDNKANKLDISVEVKLDLPSFSVEGGVSFTNSEAANFNEQEFFAKYDVQTSALRTRSSVLEQSSFQDILDTDVHQRLIRGDLEATHYISEIRYGGYATGRFTLQSNMDHHLFSLGGKVGGSVPIIPGIISVGLQARIKYSTEKNKEHLSVNVKVSANPEPDVPMPQSLEEMFTYIEKLPEALQRSTKPAWENANETVPLVKGVPISLTLSPLTMIVPELEDKATYSILEPTLLDRFTKMIFHLNDLAMKGPYKALVIKEDARLDVFFGMRNFNEMNQWAQEVVLYEERVVQEAIDFMEKVNNVLSSFKAGKRTEEDLEDELKSFEGSILTPGALKETAVNQAKEGLLLLSTVRAHQAALTGQSEVFIFTLDEWRFFDSDTRGPSLRLATPLVEKPGGRLAEILYQLYEMTPNLAAVGIRVRIALPNVRNQLQLLVRLNLVEKENSFGDDTEILEHLKLLRYYADARASGRMNNGARFLSVLSEIYGIGNLPNWKVADVPIKLELLKRSLKINGETKLCETSLETRKALSKLTSEINFILFPQFVSNLYHSLFFWKELFLRLPLGMRREITTIVASIDSFPSLYDAPHMVVLDKNGEILYILHDQLDFFVVSNAISGGQLEDSSSIDFASFTRNLSSITPNHLDSIWTENTIELCAIISPYSNKTQALKNQQAIRAFGKVSEVNAHRLQEAAEVISLCAFPPKSFLVSKVAPVPITLLGGKLLDLLQKVKYDKEQGFPEQSPDDWATLATSLLQLKGELDTDSNEEKWLSVLIAAVKFAGSGNSFALKEVLTWYADQAINGPSIPIQKGEIYNLILEKIEDISDEKYQNGVLEILKLVRLFERHPNYFKVWRVFDSQELDTSRKFLEFMGLLVEFSEEEKKAVWGSKKVQAWALHFIGNSTVLAQTYKALEEEGTLPYWFPKFAVKDALVQFEGVLKGPMIPWNPLGDKLVWKGAAEMVESLGILLSIGISVPKEFMSVLLKSLEESEGLKVELEGRDLLFFWHEDEKHFIRAWSMDEILQAFENLRGTKLFKRPERAAIKLYSAPAEALSLIYRRTYNSKEGYLALNASWAKFAQNGRIPTLSFAEFQSNVQDHIEKPLFVWDLDTMKEVAGSCLSYLTSALKSQTLLRNLKTENVSTLFDYPVLKNGSRGKLPSKRANNLQIQKEEINDHDRKWTALSRFCLGGTLPDVEEYQNLQKVGMDNTLSILGSGFFFSRSDLLTLLLSVAEESMKTYILMELMNSSPVDKTVMHALPWLIPDITKEILEPVELTQCLKRIPLPNGLKGRDGLPSNLLETPFKAILAIRIGSVPSDGFGKSTILNDSILRGGGFSSKFAPGYENGLPISRDGLVELIWLSEETCHPGFYEKFIQPYNNAHEREPFLLSNVHGDFLNDWFPAEEIYRKLAPYLGGILIFWSCRDWAEMKAGKAQLNKIFERAYKKIPNFNFVLYPDHTILKEVPEECVILTEETSSQQNYVERMQESMGKILNLIDPAICNETEEDISFNKLLQLIKTHGISEVRSSFHLQNKMEESLLVPERKQLRTDTLQLFQDFLSIEDSMEQIWILEESLTMLTNNEASPLRQSLGDVSQLKLDFEEKGEAMLPIKNYGICHLREQLSARTLHVSHIIREHLLQDEEIIAARLATLFQTGFPLELFNPNFYRIWQDFNRPLVQIIDGLQAAGKKFLVLSVLGPQGSGKSALLNSIFGKAFHTGSFGCSDGITARILQLKEEIGNEVDSILLLDSEGFSRPESYYDPAFPKMERMIGSLLLSVSDFSFLFGGTDGGTDWEERLVEILEYYASSLCTVLAKEDDARYKIPKLLFPERMERFRDSGLVNQDVVQAALFQGLENVRQLFDRYMLESNMTFLFVPQVVEFYASCLTSNARYNVEERQTILDYVFANAQTPNEGSWGENAARLWTKIKEEIHPFEEYVDCPSYKDELDRNSKLTQVRNVFDYVYESHESYAEQILLEEDNLEEALDHLNGLPFACPILTKKICYCEEGLQELEKLEEELHPTEMELKEMSLHMASLRNDIISRVSQEYYSQKLKEGDDQSMLAKKLKDILLDYGENAWIPFKQFLASLITFPSWMGLLTHELNEVYPFVNEWDEVDALPIKDIWNFEKLPELGQSPVDVQHFVSEPGWQDSIWLELELEKIVRESSLGSSGYKRGMLRGMKQKIEALIHEDFQKRVRTNEEFWLEPEFSKAIHMYGVGKMKAFFQSEWERWGEDWDILRILEERKDDFPNDMFPIKDY